MKIRLFMTVLLVCFAMFQTAFAGVQYSKEDLKGDDFGGGTVTYPLDKSFVKGCFDLTKVSLSEDKDNYIFEIEINTDFKNAWATPGGFDVQLFDIYMNLGTGKHKQTIMGRNVKIAEGWDVGFFISPASLENNKKEISDKNKKVWDNVSKPENLISDIYFPDNITVKGKKLTAAISKKSFDLSKLNGLQVFVLSFEGFASIEESYNRLVNKTAEEWRFGGGSDGFADPNVIDILGDNRDLQKYVEKRKAMEYATVKLVK